MHVRQGVHWQNIAPANGREFTADDIVYHFNRMLGIGGGFTTMDPYWVAATAWATVKSISATDKYTVVMKWTVPNEEYIYEEMMAPGCATSIENPEAVKQWGDLNDPKHAIGTGPFICTEFVSGSSLTMSRNPNYWGYDERYPKNQLPYVDKLNFLIIPDLATALAALRTGKVDVMDNVPNTQVQSVAKSNPEILQVAVNASAATYTVDPRNDLKPFSDIRVRQALQLAIDLPTIAKTYYNGKCSPDPSTATSNYMAGWGYPYSQWPQDLKDQYAYNPTQAKQLLSDAGYPNGFNTDCVADNSSDLDLLQIVKSYFAAIGVNMTIQTMDPAAWVNYVSVGHNNTGLAVRANGNLGFSYAPFIQFLRYQPGNQANYMNVNDPVWTGALNQAYAATTVDQVKQVLTNADKEVAQQHYVISLLQPPAYSLCQPWLKGFNAQYGATWGYGGVQLLWYYDARYWVDQNLKKSMGH